MGSRAVALIAFVEFALLLLVSVTWIASQTGRSVPRAASQASGPSGTSKTSARRLFNFADKQDLDMRFDAVHSKLDRLLKRQEEMQEQLLEGQEQLLEGQEQLADWIKFLHTKTDLDTVTSIKDPLAEDSAESIKPLAESEYNRLIWFVKHNSDKFRVAETHGGFVRRLRKRVQDIMQWLVYYPLMWRTGVTAEHMIIAEKTAEDMKEKLDNSIQQLQSDMHDVTSTDHYSTSYESELEGVLLDDWLKSLDSLTRTSVREMLRKQQNPMAGVFESLQLDVWPPAPEVHRTRGQPTLSTSLLYLLQKFHDHDKRLGTRNYDLRPCFHLLRLLHFPTYMPQPRQEAMLDAVQRRRDQALSALEGDTSIPAFLQETIISKVLNALQRDVEEAVKDVNSDQDGNNQGQEKRDQDSYNQGQEQWTSVFLTEAAVTDAVGPFELQQEAVVWTLTEHHGVQAKSILILHPGHPMIDEETLNSATNDMQIIYAGSTVLCFPSEHLLTSSSGSTELFTAGHEKTFLVWEPLFSGTDLTLRAMTFKALGGHAVDVFTSQQGIIAKRPAAFGIEEFTLPKGDSVTILTWRTKQVEILPALCDDDMECIDGKVCDGVMCKTQCDDETPCGGSNEVCDERVCKKNDCTECRWNEVCNEGYCIHLLNRVRELQQNPAILENLKKDVQQEVEKDFQAVTSETPVGELQLNAVLLFENFAKDLHPLVHFPSLEDVEMVMEDVLSSEVPNKQLTVKTLLSLMVDALQQGVLETLSGNSAKDVNRLDWPTSELFTVVSEHWRTIFIKETTVTDTVGPVTWLKEDGVKVWTGTQFGLQTSSTLVLLPGHPNTGFEALTSATGNTIVISYLDGKAVCFPLLASPTVGVELFNSPHGNTFLVWETPDSGPSRSQVFEAPGHTFQHVFTSQRGIIVRPTFRLGIDVLTSPKGGSVAILAMHGLSGLQVAILPATCNDVSECDGGDNGVCDGGVCMTRCDDTTPCAGSNEVCDFPGEVCKTRCDDGELAGSAEVCFDGKRTKWCYDEMPCGGSNEVCDEKGLCSVDSSLNLELFTSQRQTDIFIKETNAVGPLALTQGLTVLTSKEHAGARDKSVLIYLPDHPNPNAYEEILTSATGQTIHLFKEASPMAGGVSPPPSGRELFVASHRKTFLIWQALQNDGDSLPMQTFDVPWTPSPHVFTSQQGLVVQGQLTFDIFLLYSPNGGSVAIQRRPEPERVDILGQGLHEGIAITQLLQNLLAGVKTGNLATAKDVNAAGAMLKSKLSLTPEQRGGDNACCSPAAIAFFDNQLDNVFEAITELNVANDEWLQNNPERRGIQLDWLVLMQDRLELILREAYLELWQKHGSIKPDQYKQREEELDMQKKDVQERLKKWQTR